MKITLFSTDPYFPKKFLEYDIEAQVVEYSEIEKRGVSAIVESINSFKPDLIIEREFNDGKSIYTQVYDLLPNIPKAWWMIDMHTDMATHLAYSKQFNFVFCAQSWFIPFVKAHSKAEAYYLPLCVPLSREKLLKLAKRKVREKHDIVFVGNIRSFHEDRRKIVGELLKSHPENFLSCEEPNYAKMLDLMRGAKVAVNPSLNLDVNFRFFEACLSGKQVCDYIPDMENFPELHPYIQVYDRTEGPKIARLTVETALSTSQNEGALEVLAQMHTLDNRYQSLLQMVAEGNQV